MKKRFFLNVFMIVFILFSVVVITGCGGSGGDKAVKETGYKVYLNSKELSSTNNSLEITYDSSSTSDWRDNVCLYKTLSDGSEEMIGDRNAYSIEGPDEIMPSANEEGYDVKVSYKEYETSTFKLIVNKASVQRPMLDSNYAIYDGVSEYFGIININYGDIGTKYIITSGGDKRINAGNYSTTFTLKENYKWDTEENGSYTAPHTVNWKVEKAQINIPLSFNQEYYDGDAKTPTMNDDKYELAFEQSFKNVGIYDVSIKIKDDYSANYEWEDGTSTTKVIEDSFEIYSSGAICINEARQTESVTYHPTNLNGTADNTNPLNVSFDTSVGGKSLSIGNDVVVTTEINTIDGIPYAKYIRKNGIWKLYDNDNLPMATIDAGDYYAKVSIPSSTNYSSGEGTSFNLTIDPIVITETLPQAITKEFNGDIQYAGISDGANYTVFGDSGFVAVGEYFISLEAKKNYIFDIDGEKRKIFSVAFNITKAQNSITNLTIDDWEITYAASSPTATAKFGQIEYKWSSSEDGEYTSFEYQTPSAIGTYYLKAMVASDYNFYGVTSDAIEFSITKINVNKAGRESSIILGESYKSISNGDVYYWLADGGSIPQDVLISMSNSYINSDDFDISVTNNTEVGQGTIKATFKNNYIGEITKQFNIIDDFTGLLNQDIVEFCGLTTINEKIVIDKSLTFIIPYGIKVVGVTSDNLFEISGENTAIKKLTIVGGGTIDSTITGNYSTLCVNDINGYLSIEPLYIYSEEPDANGIYPTTGNIKIETKKGDETSKVSNFKTELGDITIKMGYYFSEYINIWSDSSRVKVYDGTFTTDTASIYMTGETSTVELDGGKFMMSSKVAEATKAVGVEILAGELIIGENAKLLSDVESFYILEDSAPIDIIYGDVGNIKAAIVVGKPNGYDDNGDIDITIKKGAVVSNSGSSISDIDKLIVWDITYGYKDYDFNLIIEDGAELSVGSSSIRQIKQGNVIHNSNNFSVYELSKCTGVVLDSLAVLNADDTIELSIDDIMVNSRCLLGYGDAVDISYGEVVDDLANYVKKQQITLTGKGSVYGEYQFTIYYLQKEHIVEGLNFVPEKAIVVFTENISFDSQATLYGRELTFIVPQLIEVCFVTNPLAINQDTIVDKSAFAILRDEEGVPSNITILGGGHVCGRQAIDVELSSEYLTSASLFYVDGVSTLTLRNIAVIGNYQSSSPMIIMTLNGNAIIDEACVISGNNTCIDVLESGYLKIIRGRNNASGVMNSDVNSVINNSGIVDYSCAYGTTEEYIFNEGTEVILGNIPLGKKEYSIIFNANGANGNAPEASNYFTGAILPQEKTMNKDLYVFVGWSTDINASQGFVVCPYLGENEEYILYAIWVEVIPEFTKISLFDQKNGYINLNDYSYCGENIEIVVEGVNVSNGVEYALDEESTGIANFINGRILQITKVGLLKIVVSKNGVKEYITLNVKKGYLNGFYYEIDRVEKKLGSDSSANPLAEDFEFSITYSADNGLVIDETTGVVTYNKVGTFLVTAVLDTNIFNPYLWNNSVQYLLIVEE